MAWTNENATYIKGAKLSYQWNHVVFKICCFVFFRQSCHFFSFYKIGLATCSTFCAALLLILDTIVQTNVLLVCTHYHIGLINTDFNELLTLPEHQSSHPVFSGVRVIRSIVFCVMFCRTLFILLSFFCWPLCCLSVFELRILITPLVFSNSSDS
jgi:hypothetical protein